MVGGREGAHGTSTPDHLARARGKEKPKCTFHSIANPSVNFCNNKRASPPLVRLSRTCKQAVKSEAFIKSARIFSKIDVDHSSFLSDSLIVRELQRQHVPKTESQCTQVPY
eukprot:scaffold15910_cov193-Amphora_coffeaeformis.AAC.10